MNNHQSPLAVVMRMMIIVSVVVSLSQLEIKNNNRKLLRLIKFNHRNNSNKMGIKLLKITGKIVKTRLILQI